jgi:hypothetical protein
MGIFSSSIWINYRKEKGKENKKRRWAGWAGRLRVPGSPLGWAKDKLA